MTNFKNFIFAKILNYVKLTNNLFFDYFFCFLQCILLGSDSTLAILKSTVKRDQTASVFVVVSRDENPTNRRLVKGLSANEQRLESFCDSDEITKAKLEIAV